MDDKSNPNTPEKTSYEILMRKVAIGVLVVGLSVAAIVFALSPPEVEEDFAGVYVTTIDNSKKYEQELERIGGKSAVVAAELNSWFDSLWHGRRLAGTLAVLSIGVSMLCFLAAKLPPLDEK